MLRFMIAMAMVAVVPGVAFSQTQVWSGRDLAANAEPIRVTTPKANASVAQKARGNGGREYPYRPPRAIYFNPFGQVTVWSGEAPEWVQQHVDAYEFATPAERKSSMINSRRKVLPGSCGNSSGPATASAAIAAAVHASGDKCR